MVSFALVHYLPDAAGIQFLKWRNVAFAISAILIVASIALFATRGLNFGIDFRGGTLIEIETPTTADVGAIRDSLNDLGLGDVQAQSFGSDTAVLIQVEQQDGEGREGELAQQAAAQSIRSTLESTIPGVEFRRTEVVGPKVSGELVQAGGTAVGLALLLMLAYIWWRFEWQFSVGAVAALAHDVILTIGMFALTQLEFNLSIIAAILTIVGYSMNDTVVVYDRVREKIRKYKKMPLPELLDFAINKTLSRTILTSVTTLLALLSLFILGGEALRGFSFAMIWGVVIGTYSSIFIAAPLLLITGVKREKLLLEVQEGSDAATP